jgi:hypothetical protein
MTKTCYICGNTNLQQHITTDSEDIARLWISSCLNCFNNNYIASYGDRQTGVIRTYPYVNLTKITKITSNFKTVKELDYLDRNAFLINNDTYVATDVYTINDDEERTSIWITKDIPIDYNHDLYITYQKYDTDIDFIDVIKSSKSPEDAINTINILLLFN